MSETEKKSNNGSFKAIHNVITVCLILILIVVFALSLSPNATIALDNSEIFLLVIIVVLLLSYRFREIQIPGLLKLSNAVESVRRETEALRNTLLQVWTSSSATAQTTTNVEVVNNLLNEAERRIERRGPVERTRISDVTQRTDEERVFEYFRHGDNTAAFAVLRHLLEDELITALRSRATPIPYRGLRSLAEAARKEEIINFELFDKIEIVRRIANQFIHPVETDVFFPIEKLNYAIELGIDAYHDLRRINREISRN